MAPPTGRKGACCAGQDIHDARRVADHLGIPHYVIDAEKRFADAVIADFADSYAAGETPVPCVRCNQTVKFADLTALAQGLGCERLATGHYVRRIDGPDGAGTAPRRRPGARPELVPVRHHARAACACAVSAGGDGRQAGGARARPSGSGCRWRRSPTARTSASSPSGHYADTVVRLRPDAGEPGDIVDGDGRVLGRHDGIARYTVGQGKRLGAASVDGGQRQMVVALDPARRRVVVGPRDTGTRMVRLREVNWLIPPPDAPLACQVKLRAREAPQPATVRAMAEGAEVRLDAPALPAPGQACVFYDGSRVLGGGFICRPEAAMVDAAGEGGLSPLPFGSDGGVAQR